MSKKSDLVSRLIEEVKLRHPLPDAPLAGASLLEQGAVLVLMRHLTQKQAEASVEALRAAYGDWNEVRVSQVQEIASHLKNSSRKKGTELLRDLQAPATALRDYLQDVYQQTHGLDLEFLREDIAAGGKMIADVATLGMGCGSYLLWLAGDGSIPVHTGLVRLLDRLGLVARTASMKKAREAVEPLVPKGKDLEFTVVFHEIADRWNDPREPIYMTVKALQSTAAGKKAHQERLTSEKREAERKKKEEVRRVAAEKKEAERMRKEAAREAKKAAAEAVRREREAERRRAAEARDKERERKKREVEKEKVAKQKAAEKAKASAAKKAAAKKTAKKTTKKAPTSTAAKKKPVTKKKPTTAKKTAKTTASKAAGKKTASKKGTTRKTARRR